MYIYLRIQFSTCVHRYIYAFSFFLLFFHFESKLHMQLQYSQSIIRGREND